MINLPREVADLLLEIAHEVNSVEISRIDGMHPGIAKRPAE